jgi:hypothetical protein
MSAGPFADLLMTVGSVFLLLAMTLLAQAPPAIAPAAASDAILAVGGGIRLGSSGRLVPLDAIPDDPELAAWLVRLRGSAEPPVVLVAPDGLEAAFLFDNAAGAAGLLRMATLRLRTGCAEAPEGPLRALCLRFAGGAQR